jgi:threonine aldolase
MCNQVAIKLLTQPMNEIICDKNSHIYYYEGGGWAFHSGCSIRLINGDRGRITAQDVLDNINGDNVHLPVTKLVSIENTHNKGGGSFYTMQALKDISAACRKHNLHLHLDGARIFNALTETGDSPVETGKLFRYDLFLFKQGTRCTDWFIARFDERKYQASKEIRKVFGGGMRQAGFIAAAGLYALENNISRLKEDHQRARELAKTISSLSFVKELLPVDTNIIVFTLHDNQDAGKFLSYLLENKYQGRTCSERTRYAL